jgi:hypothetical protein
MTVKEYLNDVFLYDNTQANLNFYKVSVQDKGELIAEYDSNDETVSLLHTDRSGRVFNYYTKTFTELKETVEYCLGPIVTEKQWRKVDHNITELINDDNEDWDTID